MTNGLSVSLQVPCKVVIVVKDNVLPSARRLVVELSPPTPNGRLVHVEIVDGRPFKDDCMNVRRHCAPSDTDAVVFIASILFVKNPLPTAAQNRSLPVVMPCHGQTLWVA